MKDAAHNERKYFAIVTHVNLFGINNLEFNGEVDVIDSPLERQYVTLHPPFLKGFDTLIRK